MKQHPPRQIFEKLVNKNAIKRKIGGPPLAIFPETLDPPLGILAKTSRTPPPGFSTRVHLCSWVFLDCLSQCFSTFLMLRNPK
jgi:hypothetical protein